MKKIIAVLAVAASLMLLAGCSREPEKVQVVDSSVPTNTGGPDDLTAYEVETMDGRTVDCVVWDGGVNGGFSCDWDGAE